MRRGLTWKAVAEAFEYASYCLRRLTIHIEHMTNSHECVSQVDLCCIGSQLLNRLSFWTDPEEPKGIHHSSWNQPQTVIECGDMEIV